MNKFISVVALGTLAVGEFAMAWSELGHNLVAKTAANLLKEQAQIKELLNRNTDNSAAQAFLTVFQSKANELGYVANIPDTYWRNLEAENKEAGNLLGDSTHYFNSERAVKFLKPGDYFKTKIPLDYEVAKLSLLATSAPFFNAAGSLPWRAQQFANLFSSSIQQTAKLTCGNENSLGQQLARDVISYAGLLSHFSGDAAMPLHTTVDSNGAAMGHKGLHAYFETELVNALELSGLNTKVQQLAEQLLTQKGSIDGTPTVDSLRSLAKAIYPEARPDQETTSLLFTLLANSYGALENLRQLDYTYSLASLDEALQMPNCQRNPVVEQLKKQVEAIENEGQRKVFSKVKILSEPADYYDKSKADACRRSPFTRVNGEGELAVDGKTVAQWNEKFVVSRLALAAAVTADVWAREWVRAGQNILCSTYLYAHKPSFVSPTDAVCAGYALKENPKDFLKKSGGSALPGKVSKKSTTSCIHF